VTAHLTRLTTPLCSSLVDHPTITASFVFSLALRSDGSIADWGNRTSAQFPRFRGNDFVAIATGSTDSALALRSDGSVESRGRHTDISVPRGNDFVAIEADVDGGGIAMRRDGSVAGWGISEIAIKTDSLSLIGITDITAVAAGHRQAFALKNDGSLIGWGPARISFGLMDPLGVPSGTDFTAIAAGRSHRLALRDVPEPTTLGFILASFAGLATRRRPRRASKSPHRRFRIWSSCSSSVSVLTCTHSGRWSDNWYVNLFLVRSGNKTRWFPR